MCLELVTKEMCSASWPFPCSLTISDEMIGTLRYNAEDGRRQMILVVPFMSPLAHSSHRAQQAGLHAYICDVLSPSVHLLYSPACMHAYIRHTCTALVHAASGRPPAFLLHIFLSRAREIYHARLFSIPCMHPFSIPAGSPPSACYKSSSFMWYSPTRTHAVQKSCRPGCILLFVCMLTRCSTDGCRVSVTFPSRLCQGKLSVCVHDAHVQVYPVFHGWVLFFSFLLLHLCRSKLHTYGFFTRLR